MPLAISQLEISPVFKEVSREKDKKQSNNLAKPPHYSIVLPLELQNVSRIFLLGLRTLC